MPPARNLSFGPGTQTRQSKENVIELLNLWASSKLDELSENKAKHTHFHDELCMVLYRMNMEGRNRSRQNEEPFHKEIASKCGFEFMCEKYIELLDTKKSDDDVVGGSMLTKFVKENS